MTVRRADRTRWIDSTRPPAQNPRFRAHRRRTVSDRPQPSTRVLLLSFGLVTLIAWLCTAPILERPQLDPDDARYVQIARGAGDDLPTGLDSLVVENRWDHLWWIDNDRVVRFFRPAVVTSFAIDDALAAGSLAQQAMLTDLLIHLAAGLLFAALCLRWFPATPAILAACLFTAFAAHGENLWFAAGRTGSLAGLAVIGTVSFHVQRSTTGRVLALAAFALGLAAKETAAVAPALCLLADLWVERRGAVVELLRRDRWLYGGYATILLGYLVVRAAAIGAGVEMTRPYLVPPTDPGFPAHLAAQTISYAQNLAVGTESPPFADLDAVLDRATVGGWIGAVLLVAMLVAATLRSGAGRFAMAWITLTWLPASIAYLSERYLYLPSAGVALAAAALAASIRPAGTGRAILLLTLGGWTALQAAQLHHRNHYHGVERSRALTRLAHTVAPLRERIPPGSVLWLVNCPGGWVDAQFAEPSLRLILDDPRLRVRVLNPVPPTQDLGRDVRVGFADDGALRLTSSSSPVLFDYPPGQPWRPMQPGLPIPTRRTGLQVEILRGEAGKAWDVRFRGTDPDERPVVLVWRADRDAALPPSERLQRAAVELLQR